MDRNAFSLCRLSQRGGHLNDCQSVHQQIGRLAATSRVSRCVPSVDERTDIIVHMQLRLETAQRLARPQRVTPDKTRVPPCSGIALSAPHPYQPLAMLCACYVLTMSRTAEPRRADLASKRSVIPKTSMQPRFGPRNKTHTRFELHTKERFLMSAFAG